MNFISSLNSTIMDKHNLKIRLEDELIKKLIQKAKEEGIAFEHYLIKILKKAVNTKHWFKRNLYKEGIFSENLVNEIEEFGKINLEYYLM